MRALKYMVSMCFVLFLTTGAAFEDNDNLALEGSWKGVLSAAGQSFPLIFHIKTNESGGLIASLDSPAQGAVGIPVESLSLTARQVQIDIKAAQASFVGELNKESDYISGKWKQGPNELPLKLEKVMGVIPSEIVKRPQNPQVPFPYEVEDVVFTNNQDNIELAGTLTLPSSNGVFPAVVLITGSGPQDRDQTFMGHKTFWVLADYLTRQGIAVLRFDDRGVSRSKGVFETATSLDFANDVSAAVNFLATHTNIDKNNIGLIGHSEGGLIAPITASKNQNVAFIALLAGPGQTGNEISIWQVREILYQNGLSKDASIAGSEITRALNKVVIENTDPSRLVSDLLLAYDQAWESTADPLKQEIKAIGGGSLSESRIRELSTHWTKYFLSHNPIEFVDKLSIPILAIHGDKDTQMSVKLNLSVLKSALEAKKASLSKAVEIVGANHMFQRAITGQMSEYAAIEETISPEVLKMIGDWVLVVAKTPISSQ